VRQRFGERPLSVVAQMQRAIVDRQILLKVSPALKAKA